MTENKCNGLEFVEIEFFVLNLAYQNQVYYTRDVSFLNSFENMLTNEIVWKLVLFWGVKKKKKKKPTCHFLCIYNVNLHGKYNINI